MHKFSFLCFSCNNQDFLLKYKNTCPAQIHLSNRRWQSSQNTNLLCCKTYTSGSFIIFDTTIVISTLLLVRATSSHPLGHKCLLNLQFFNRTTGHIVFLHINLYFFRDTKRRTFRSFKIKYMWEWILP